MPLTVPSYFCGAERQQNWIITDNSSWEQSQKEQHKFSRSALKNGKMLCFFVKYLHCLFIKFTAQDLPRLSQAVQYESFSAEHIRHFSSADSFIIFCVSRHSAGQQSDTINMHRANVV